MNGPCLMSENRLRMRAGASSRTRLLARTRVAGAAALVAFGLMMASVPDHAHAENPFSPRLYVNDGVITAFEVEQRARFLQVLNAPGDPETEALKALTNDRLQTAEARRQGIAISEDALRDGMEEFASRAEMTAAELSGELENIGVATETFRDFVHAGLLWREVVRQKYQGQIAVSDADIDRALEAAARPNALKARVSELVIPLEPGQEDAAMALANRLSDEIHGEAAFAAAARRHSAAPTAGNGGQVPDWLPLSNLPPVIARQILALGEGEASAPIQVPNAVVLFLLRDVAEDERAEPITVSVEWAEYLVPDDGAEIARIAARADACNDLYGLARGQPADRLTMHEAERGAIPADVALELARLDPGEISAAARRGELRRVLMLCGRHAVTDPEMSREEALDLVVNQRLDGLAARDLEELRAAAFIREP